MAVSYSGEYDVFADSGEPLLQELCSYTQGELYTDMVELAREQVSPIGMIYDPLILFAIIVAVLMLADIAIRKLRWKDIRNYFRK